MKKARPGAERSHVSVRLSNTQIERIDALAKLCSTPWREVTRSDVLRFLLLQSLERADQNEALVVTEFHRVNVGGSSA